ncbi:MAG: hypothetical protein Q8M92_03450 [Candidatus Subteraquimicrobiales bacterium]|nr:hypothetical protein [Candidatus Subteraquimicrobiales bacterium]
MVGNQKESLNFELEKRYVDKIREIAGKDDTSMSEIVRLCVIEGLMSIYGPIKL